MKINSIPPPPTPPPPPSQPPQAEIEALRDIRSFSLLAIIATLLIGIGSISIFFGFLFIPAPRVGLSTGLAALSILIILVIIGAIIYLIALFRLRSGYSKLKNIHSEFGICYTGTTLILIGLILVIVGALLTIILIGIPIFILGAIILFIGEILALIVGAFRLNSKYGEGLYLAAGILFIIGIFIGLATFIGMILFYIATSSTIRRLGGTT